MGSEFTCRGTTLDEHPAVGGEKQGNEDCLKDMYPPYRQINIYIYIYDFLTPTKWQVGSGKIILNERKLIVEGPLSTSMIMGERVLSSLDGFLLDVSLLVRCWGIVQQEDSIDHILKLLSDILMIPTCFSPH